MAYFSNGTEGLDWQAQNCFAGKGCVNWRANGCAVWAAHMLFNYEACNDKLGRGILGVLIPEVDSPHGYKVAGPCAMKVEMGDIIGPHTSWDDPVMKGVLKKVKA